MDAREAFRISSAALRRALVVIATVISAAILLHHARASTLQTLYDFCSQKDSQTGFCLDGSSPLAPLARDSSGNLFGTTSGGGQQNSGTVFEIGNGPALTLYDFCRQPSCTDGSQPQAGLVRDTSGNLYGAAKTGGQYGAGVVFELSPVSGGWNYVVLHDFCGTGCGDGARPTAGLLMDTTGNLYGTTEAGGLGAAGLNNGTVFKLTFNKTSGQWSERVLYAFCAKISCADGAAPEASVIRDSDGNIYGTTENGGKHSAGTVFKLVFDSVKKKWKEQVLRSFCSQSGTSNSCKDGATPLASLAMDGSGNLFGTAVQGGIGNPGAGVVFKLTFDAPTGTYAFSVLHHFCKSSSICGDGEFPKAGLVLDGTGNLYGTTASSSGLDPNNNGVVFRITPAGKKSFLARFCGNFCPGGTNNGSTPEAPVIMDSSGNLYGTTHYGGLHQAGVVFEVTP